MNGIGKVAAISLIGKQRTEKIKMSNKFKRWFRNWLHNDEPIAMEVSTLKVNDDLDSPTPLRITIHKAAGGLVVETRTYDRLKDRTHQNLHVITHDQDLSSSLSKIITMENLRA